MSYPQAGQELDVQELIEHAGCSARKVMEKYEMDEDFYYPCLVGVMESVMREVVYRHNALLHERDALATLNEEEAA